MFNCLASFSNGESFLWMPIALSESQDFQLEMMYYVISAEGKIGDEERKKFNSLAKLIHGSYGCVSDLPQSVTKYAKGNDKAFVIEKIEKGIDDRIEYHNRIVEIANQAYVDAAGRNYDREFTFLDLWDEVEQEPTTQNKLKVKSEKEFIRNLVCVACSDGDYSQNQKTVIGYIVSKLDLDKKELTLVENEFCNPIKGVKEVENQIKWVNGLNYPEDIKNKIIEDLQKRVNIISNIRL